MVSNQHYTDRLSKASGIYAATYIGLSKCGTLISLLDFLQSHRCYWASSKATPYARTQVGSSSHRQSKSYFKSSPTKHRATLPTYRPTKLLIYQPALLFTFRTTAILPTGRFDLLFFGFSIWCAHDAAVLSTFPTPHPRNVLTNHSNLQSKQIKSYQYTQIRIPNQPLKLSCPTQPTY